MSQRLQSKLVTVRAPMAYILLDGDIYDENTVVDLVAIILYFDENRGTIHLL